MLLGSSLLNLLFLVKLDKQISVICFDILVASHADADHIGGLSGALNYTTADLILCPVTNHTTKTFDSFKRYAEL